METNNVNAKQMAATKLLEKALESCHKAGLQGGVYDCSFVVWPVEGQDPRDDAVDFFQSINKNGVMINTAMNLDGGAGV